MRKGAVLGGFGSTRWGWHSKATTVEECRSLDVNRWIREGIIVPESRRWGSWVWTNRYTNKQAASIGYEVNTTGSPPWVRLYYTVTPWAGDPVDYDYKIALVSTMPNYGGLRWWFVCPLVTGGRACMRRVGKLYMPPGGRYYGCRHCYRLTYESAQEHDPRVPEPYRWRRRSRRLTCSHALIATSRFGIAAWVSSPASSIAPLMAAYSAMGSLASRDTRGSCSWALS